MSSVLHPVKAGENTDEPLLDEVHRKPWVLDYFKDETGLYRAHIKGGNGEITWVYTEAVKTEDQIVDACRKLMMVFDRDEVVFAPRDEHPDLFGEVQLTLDE